MSVILAEELAEASKEGKPIVALETAVLTSGLPHYNWVDSFGECPQHLDRTLPINVSLANAMTAIVTEQGALPVWVGVLNGTLKIGLSENELLALAQDESASKVSYANLAQVMKLGLSAGTTVASTLLACKLGSPTAPIRVFATGGIGGIHQQWSTRLDISADLTALATTPTCVVSSGVKSILDLHATVESLETIGVPIVGMNTTHFPPFIEQSIESDPEVLRVDSATQVAEICNTHWSTLGLGSSVLATVPVPEDVAIERGSLAELLSAAESAWAESSLPSATRTPFLLNTLAERTDGKSLAANVALLCNNAYKASEIALAISTH